MKKLCLLMAVLLLLSSLSLSAFAAGSDFEIKDEVLVRYKGSAAGVTLPSEISSVGANAFKGNTAVKSISIPDTVYEIGEQAFYGCSSLTSVSGGGNVSRVGDLAFNGTPYLDKSTVKYLVLGHVLLWYNGTSQGVTIPSHCTAVASYAFMKCDYLTSFTAYDGLLSVGTGAFYSCSKLSDVNLPSTVSSVGAYAFDGTPYLASLGEFAAVGDNVLIKYSGSDTSVSVPEGITRIAPHAFTGSKISSINLPESVYLIDDYAFADCVGLSDISLNEGLVSIGNGAFRGCKSLNGFVSPLSLQYIGQQAFRGSAISSAVLTGKGLNVSYNAFKGCDRLQYVLLSSEVGAIYDNAFDSCTGLEGISVPPSLSEISPQSLSNCPKVIVFCDEKSPAQTALSANKISTVNGDSDNDGVLTIIDSSLIQYYIADLMKLRGSQVAAADFNYDAVIDIRDAFWIQMKSVGLV